MTSATIATMLGSIAALILAAVAFIKVGSEKKNIQIGGQVSIVGAQDTIIENLQEENARLIKRLDVLEARFSAEIGRLRAERDTLRERVKHLEEQLDAMQHDMESR